MNRYFDTTVDNVPAEDTDGYDIEMFPIESVVKALRPTKGAIKAMVGAAMVSDVYTDTNMPRFYVASNDDKYKYWISPNRSNATTGAITGCQPFVLYEKNLNINKVVIKLENTWASPVDWVVEFTTNGTDWGTAAGVGNTVTNPTISNSGQVTLYWNGTSWSSTRPSSIAATKSIRGLRLRVNQLGAGKLKDGTTTSYLVWNDDGDPATGAYTSVATTGKDAHFSLIELSARLEIDVSSNILSLDSTFDAGESDMLTPMGGITTNVGSMSIWDAEGYFDKDNQTSPYYDLLEPNAEVSVQYAYYLNGRGSAATDTVQELKMYVSDWGVDDGGVVNVSLEDCSKFLKEETIPEMMYENVTLTEIVYRVCDSIGFSDYTIIDIDSNKDFVIPVWWSNGEETAWEVFDRLARDTQSLIYFDQDGILNIRPRYAAFDPARSIDWTLLGLKSGSDLSDILDLSKTGSYESNLIKVMYTNTRWSEWNNGNPSMETVWEPEGTLALRAAHIVEDIPETGATYVRITPKDAKIWPFESMVNIEGEVFKFDAKEYTYHTGTTTATPVKVWLTSQEDYDKYYKDTPREFQQLNGFSGKLRIKERGVWNSRVREHSYKVKTGYTSRRYVEGHNITSTRGITHNVGDSSVTLAPAGALVNPNHRLLMTTGSSGQTGDYRHYGTRMRFEKGDGLYHQIAGLVFNNQGTAEDGYYVEITPTNKLSAADRKARHEVAFYVRKNGLSRATRERIGCTPLNLGSQSDVKEFTFTGDYEESAKQAVYNQAEYDIDVRITELSSGKHHVRVWINGREKINTYVASADTIPLNTKFGVYIRGKTKATFDYLYAVRDHANLVEPLDDMSFFDRVRGGYYGTYAMQEIPYEKSTQNLLPKQGSTKRRNNRPDFYFDEFGAMINEVREFDVKFTEAPTLHNRLFLTNDWSATCLEYRSTPFSAHFILANTSRQTSVINGTESIVFGGGARDVDHVTSVVGRTLTIDEAKEYEVKNEDQIRARGEIETQIESTWIQTEEAAKVVGDWIGDFWSTGQDEVTATVFGNPLFQVGDLVAVNYPARHMNPTDNRYYITSVGTEFDNGIQTTLVMRRKAYAS